MSRGDDVKLGPLARAGQVLDGQDLRGGPLRPVPLARDQQLGLPLAGLGPEVQDRISAGGQQPSATVGRGIVHPLAARQPEHLSRRREVNLFLADREGRVGRDISAEHRFRLGPLAHFRIEVAPNQCVALRPDAGDGIAVRGEQEIAVRIGRVHAPVGAGQRRHEFRLVGPPGDAYRLGPDRVVPVDGDQGVGVGVAPGAATVIGVAST